MTKNMMIGSFKIQGVIVLISSGYAIDAIVASGDDQMTGNRPIVTMRNDFQPSIFLLVVDSYSDSIDL